MSSYLEMKKQALLMTDDRWWLPFGMNVDEVLCAYQFEDVATENLALTNLADSGKYPLTKDWGQTQAQAPVWSRANGFAIQKTLGNDDSRFYNNQLNSAYASVKSAFACYSDLDVSQGYGASLIMFPGQKELHASVVAFSESRDPKDTHFYNAPGFLYTDGNQKVLHTVRTSYQWSSREPYSDDAGNIYGYHYYYSADFQKTSGVLGFSGNVFYVDGVATDTTSSTRPSTSHGGIFGNQTRAGWVDWGGYRWDLKAGYSLKAVVVFKRELTPSEAKDISTVMIQRFL